MLMASSRQRLLLVLLAGLAAFAWWLGIPRDSGRVTEDLPSRQPDHQVEGLKITTMDEDGLPRRRLIAREARHYPGGEGSELDEPRLTLFTPTGPPWLLRSERGWVAEKGEEVRLLGAVFLDREATGESPPLRVETREVFIWPDDHYARTEHPLHAISGPDWLDSASGGEAWFGEDLRARLFGRVLMEYGLQPKPEPAGPATEETP